MRDIDDLNQNFGLSGQIQFSRRSGNLLIAEIQNRNAKASLALQGAQILNWQPIGSEPVFWVSPNASFREGSAIRGGIPICWPWFGAHPKNTELPNHGIARTQPWKIVRTGSLPDDETEMSLQLVHDPQKPSVWPHATPLHLRIVVGQTLKLQLTTKNLAPQPVTVGCALHAYFAVGDVRHIHIRGLEGRPYLDLVQQGAKKLQKGPVKISEETDRVYQDTSDDCRIEDSVLNRRIRISKRGSRSTVVWNPWVKKAAALADMGPDQHLGMVCVESANAANDQVTIMPGHEHHLEVSYSVEGKSKLTEAGNYPEPVEDHPV